MGVGGVVALAASIYVIVGAFAAIGISIATGKAAEATGAAGAADKIRSDLAWLCTGGSNSYLWLCYRANLASDAA